MNGFIKRWKDTDQIMPNLQIPLINAFVHIICAIYNSFRLPKIKPNNDVELVFERTVNIINKSNQLKTLVESEN